MDLASSRRLHEKINGLLKVLERAGASAELFVEATEVLVLCWSGTTTRMTSGVPSRWWTWR